MGVQVDQVQVEALKHDERQEKYGEIADSHHPPAQRARVPSVDIGAAIENHQQHGADLHQHQRHFSLFRHGIRHKDKQSQHAAYGAQRQHDIGLYLLQKLHCFSLQIPILQ